ncbi:MAG TPA: tetratricopeptide repeat protein [Nocardioides sp.]|nr:tetratricopeptide repeat protein [Nocardioides sp.]
MADNREASRIRSLIEVGRFAQAQEALGRLLAEAPDEAGLHALMARVSAKLEQPDAARRHAERACALAPGDAGNLRVLAQVLWDGGDLHAARGAAIAAVHRQPASWYSHALFAQIQASLAPQSSEAHNAALRAVDLAPNNAEAHFAAGYVFQAEGDKKRARQAYGTVLRIDPHHAGAMNNLAVMGGSLVDQARGYRSALAEDPHDKIARRNLEQVVPRLVFTLWVVGATLAIVGGFSTVRGHTLADSRPNGFSIGMGIAGTLGYLVYLKRVVDHLPASARGHLVRRAWRGMSGKWLVLVSVLMFCVGETACFLSGGAQLARQALVPVAVTGAIQLYHRLGRG